MADVGDGRSGLAAATSAGVSLCVCRDDCVFALESSTWALLLILNTVKTRS